MLTTRITLTSYNKFKYFVRKSIILRKKFNSVSTKIKFLITKLFNKKAIWGTTLQYMLHNLKKRRGIMIFHANVWELEVKNQNEWTKITDIQGDDVSVNSEKSYIDFLTENMNFSTLTNGEKIRLKTLQVEADSIEDIEKNGKPAGFYTVEINKWTEQGSRIIAFGEDCVTFKILPIGEEIL
ncbi:hypothetical protein ACEWPB_29530 (plasmid) [Priestia megaterium]|uniref:hypothetical protein n=1 Tax=Priestia megaterium TaxID=1404 RepID=UPI0035CC40D8